MEAVSSDTDPLHCWGALKGTGKSILSSDEAIGDAAPLGPEAKCRAGGQEPSWDGSRWFVHSLIISVSKK